MPVEVIFRYHESTRKWEARVTGAKDKVEARQAFAAVVHTCSQLNLDFLNKTIVNEMEDGSHYIIPAV